MRMEPLSAEQMESLGILASTMTGVPTGLIAFCLGDDSIGERGYAVHFYQPKSISTEDTAGILARAALSLGFGK